MVTRGKVYGEELDEGIEKEQMSSYKMQGTT